MKLSGDGLDIKNKVEKGLHLSLGFATELFVRVHLRRGSSVLMDCKYFVRSLSRSECHQNNKMIFIFIFKADVIQQKRCPKIYFDCHQKFYLQCNFFPQQSWQSYIQQKFV